MHAVPTSLIIHLGIGRLFIPPKLPHYAPHEPDPAVVRVVPECHLKNLCVAEVGHLARYSTSLLSLPWVAGWAIITCWLPKRVEIPNHLPE